MNALFFSTFFFFIILLFIESCTFDSYELAVRQHASRSTYPSFVGWLRQKAPKRRRNRTTTTAGPIIIHNSSMVVTEIPLKPTLNHTVFRIVINEQRNAKNVPEAKYRWIARVVHSPDKDEPYLCTAACIEDRIFITTARCIYGMRVGMMSVLYNNNRLRPLTFIFPSKPTKQMFDDVGFIVVNETGRISSWNKIGVYDRLRREDDHFFWFKGNLTGTVVGFVNITYAGVRMQEDKVVPDPPFQVNLFEMPCYMSTYLCQHLYNRPDYRSKLITTQHGDFFVPCYHSCSVDNFYNKATVCNNRLAGEGHMIIERETERLIGIASWAGYTSQEAKQFTNLPVGMAVPISETYKTDLTCARKKVKDLSDPCL